MVTGMGRSLRRRRSRSGVIMVSPRSIIDQVGLLLPVGLQEDAVDVVDVDGLAGAATPLNQAPEAEMGGLARHAGGRGEEGVDGGAGEGVVPQSGAVEL